MVWVLPPDFGVNRKLSLVPIRGCPSLRKNPSDADMGTDTLLLAEFPSEHCLFVAGIPYSFGL